jgi:hypothetical protein
MNCPQYGPRLEENLSARKSGAEIDPGFRLHMEQCANCREAFETALLASQLVRDAQRPVKTQEAFVTRVMAAIREQELRLAGQGAIWRPLELLASRVALMAALLLLCLSFYVVKFAPVSEQGAAINGQTEIGTGLPERPTLPANQDEVLMSLADMDNGI